MAPALQAYSTAAMSRSFPSSDSDRRQSCLQGRCAHEVQHALEVVSHHRQADLGPSSVQSTQKKTGMAEDDVLENGEGMLHGSPPQLHRRRSGAVLHALQGTFMYVATNDAPWTDSALRFESTGSAHRRPAEIDDR